MSDPLLDAIKSGEINKTYEMLMYHIPEEKHLIAAFEHLPRVVRKLLIYKIQTNVDVIEKCIDLFYENEALEEYEPGNTFEYRMIKEDMFFNVLELISLGYKTENPFELCRFGIYIESIHTFEYQFDDVIKDKYDDLLFYAIFYNNLPATSRLIDAGAKYNEMGYITESSPIERLIYPGRFTKSAV